MNKEKRNKYINDWKRENTKRIALNLRIGSKELDHLEKQTNKTAYIIELIHKDMEK